MQPMPGFYLGFKFGGGGGGGGGDIVDNATVGGRYGRGMWHFMI